MNVPAAATHDGATASVSVMLRASSKIDVLVAVICHDTVAPAGTVVPTTQLLDAGVQLAGFASVHTSLMSAIRPGVAHAASRM